VSDEKKDGQVSYEQAVTEVMKLLYKKCDGDFFLAMSAAYGAAVSIGLITEELDFVDSMHQDTMKNRHLIEDATAKFKEESSSEIERIAAVMAKKETIH
jgi:hypothetical protein